MTVALDLKGQPDLKADAEPQERPVATDLPVQRDHLDPPARLARD